MEDFLLRVEHVSKHYSGHTALDDVSLDIPRGSVYGLLGPNGAGKTTLIRIVNRITAPDEGRVLFDGRPLASADVQRIGYLPEERGLYKKMKVGEQAVYLARLKGLSRDEAEKRLRRWFDKFEIGGWWNRKVEELSKGMQQKVQFIATVLHEPELVILDEPFSGFDPVNAELLKKEVLELKEKGCTIMFSSHNMNSVEEICDDIALINKSKVVLSGEVDEVRARYRTGYYQLVAAADRLLPEMPELFRIRKMEAKRSEMCYLLEAENPAMSNSDLLRHIVDKVEVRSFAEQLPSMHDIFLKEVGGITEE